METARSGGVNGGAPRVCLVLGAGGARGTALAAVLDRLRRERVAIDAIVGCSVGAMVGALFAAAGIEPREMIEATRRLPRSAALQFALARWRLPFLSRGARRRSGALASYLERLEAASFADLHHGVRRLGILTFDLRAREELLIHGGPGAPAALPVATAVRASSAIPGLFPPVPAIVGGRRRLLVDPGWLTAVPIERAFAPPIGARRVIAVDLLLRLCGRQRSRAYWEDLEEACGDALVVLRPEVRACGTILAGRGDREALIAAGESAVTDAALARIRAWRVDTPPSGC